MASGGVKFRTGAKCTPRPFSTGPKCDWYQHLWMNYLFAGSEHDEEVLKSLHCVLVLYKPIVIKASALKFLK